MNKLTVFAVLLALLLIASACGDDDDSGGGVPCTEACSFWQWCRSDEGSGMESCIMECELRDREDMSDRNGAKVFDCYLKFSHDCVAFEDCYENR